MKQYNTVDEYIADLNKAKTELDTKYQELMYDYTQVYDSAYEVLELIRDMFDVDNLRYAPETTFDDMKNPDTYDWFMEVSDDLADELYESYDEAYDVHDAIESYQESVSDLYHGIKDSFSGLNLPERQ